MEGTVFIVNPISGRKGSKKKILELLRKRGETVLFTQYAGHAERLARECAAKVVVAVGGDGTVNEVARGIIGSDKVLGIIPCGSGDGLALCLGISRNPHDALDVLDRGRVHEIDYARIDGHPFFSVSGVGFDAFISQKFACAGKRGLLTYVTESVKAWFGYKPQFYTLLVDGKPVQCKALLVTVSNSDQWGNGVCINPQARPDDGLLDVAVVEKFRLWELPAMAFYLFSGRMNQSSRVSSYTCRELIVMREKEGPAHFDGDYFGAGNELTFRVMPDKVRVILP